MREINIIETDAIAGPAGISSHNSTAGINGALCV